jgi:hypothetical protein
MTLVNEINKKTDELLDLLDEAGVAEHDLAELEAIINELLERACEE